MLFDPKKFGARLQSLRISRKFTQEQLAERAALSSHYIGNLEQGIRNPSLSCIMQLCAALGATPDCLFEDSISDKMRNGITESLKDAHTLRDTMNVLSQTLSDLLPLDDEETPALFGIPLHQIECASEAPAPHTLSDNMQLPNFGIQDEDISPKHP